MPERSQKNTVITGLFGAPSRVSRAEKPYMQGHRKRLRQRFLEGGAEALPDYELLELLLFRSIARKDVKPIAHQLINHFGDFNRVLCASAQELRKIEGIGDAIIHDLKIVEAATHRMARSRIIKKPLISSWDALLDYCHTVMAHYPTEQLYGLFLDNKNVLIANEKLGQGTVNHVPVYPREVVKRVLELNACALILVHNHPSGCTQPSTEDIDLTRQIINALEPLGVTLHDHLIICKSAEISFRSKGLI